MAEENVDLSLNLENLLSPFSYEPEIPLPKSIPEVPGGMYLSGFVSLGKKYLLFYYKQCHTD